MAPELISLLAQIPLVGIFVYFVLQSNKAHSVSVQANHTEWREWLAAQNKEREDWLDRQNRQWQAWIAEQNKTFLAAVAEHCADNREDKAQLAEALGRFDAEVSRMATINMLIYATLRGKQGDASGLEEALVRELQDKK
jgi:hypothetical protein